MYRTRLRRRLERKLSEVLREERPIESELRVPAYKNPDDQGIALEGEAVLKRRDAMAAREIADIRAALTRLEKGTYGICLACGGTIGSARLSAIPEAALCASCASLEDGV
jgi:RNA polymerase-binding transcription factor DksA